MKLAAVILNYNDSDGTIAAVQRIKDYALLSYIIIVDNASPDGSAEILKDFTDKINLENKGPSTGAGEKGKRFYFIASAENGGYGSGNNIGVRFASLTLGADHVIIANPDSEFAESLAAGMAGLFEKNKRLACAGAVMVHDTEKSTGRAAFEDIIASAWPRRSVSGCLINAGPLLRRLFHSKINYSPEHFKGSSAEVFAVHGSLLMVDAEAFLRVGGYDSGVFLYCEENILAERLRLGGFSTEIYLDETYIHAGAGTMRKNLIGAAARQKNRQTSEMYYYRKYLKCGTAAMAAAKLLYGIVMLETKAAAAICGRI